MPGPSLTPDFRRELVTVNLQRIPWLLVAALVLGLWSIISLWSDPATAWIRLILGVDIFSAVICLLLNSALRRLPPDSPWPPFYIWTVAVLALLYMDGYYFLGAMLFGENPSYILGLVTAATIFLLPPRPFLWLLFGNHVLYCLLLTFVLSPHGVILPIIIQNTTGAVVAGIVSLLLFRSRRQEFHQRRTLEMRNRQLNDLMAITAHDLRSPLLALRDLLTLAQKNSSPAQALEILSHASSCSSDLLALVNRLLDAHTAEEQAEHAFPLQQSDLRPLIVHAVERARNLHPSRTLMLQLPSHPVTRSVNPAALDQVLGNLLSNALKFSPPGTPVAIQLSQSACDIIDQGPGIPERDRAALFQKFQRGSSPQSGAGLGLFIAATFMHAMRGSVEYLPHPPGGSIFRLTFSA